MTETTDHTCWRARGPYLATNASKAGLLAETRQFLLTYGRLGDLTRTRQALVKGELPQRARATRETIVLIIQQRLVRWQPPVWVLADLVAFAGDPHPDSLRAALLLHITRQSTLLYDLVQQLIVSRWQTGELVIVRGDVQRFFDAAHAQHPEMDRWSFATREKLAGNLLSILRDYGLLHGSALKRIVEPIVPPVVVAHLVRLLRTEGIAADALAAHPDWQIWLRDQTQTQAVLTAAGTLAGTR